MLAALRRGRRRPFVADAARPSPSRVDGQSRDGPHLARTVGDVLDERGHRRRRRARRGRARPRRGLSDGESIVVRHGRPVVLTVDGERRDRLDDRAHRRRGPRRARPPLRRRVPLRLALAAASAASGLALDVRTPHHVTVLADGKRHAVTTTAPTVRDRARRGRRPAARPRPASPPTSPGRRSPSRSCASPGSTASGSARSEPIRLDRVERKSRRALQGQTKVAEAGQGRHRRTGRFEVTYRRRQARLAPDWSSRAGHRAKPVTEVVPSAPSPSGRDARADGTDGAELGCARQVRDRRQPARRQPRRDLLRALPVRPEHVARPSAARAYPIDATRRPSRPTGAQDPLQRTAAPAPWPVCGAPADLHAEARVDPGRADPAPRCSAPAEVRELAAALGVRPTKQLGQNFVIDANTVRRIVRTADVAADDVVVEVGPGLGSLTLGLLPRSPRSSPSRSTRCSPARCRGTVADRAPACADRLDRRARRRAAGRRGCPARRRPRWSRTCRTTSRCPVLLHLLELLPSLRRVLVMVQAEVADRLAARPGQPDVRRPVGEGALVRATCAGPARSGVPSSGRRPTSTPVWSRIDPPRPARDDGDRGPRSSRSSTRRSRSAARRCAPRSRAGPARRPRPRTALRGRRRSTRGPRGETARRRRLRRDRRAPVRRRGAHAYGSTGMSRRVDAGDRAGAGQGQPRSSRSAPPRPDGYHDLATVFQAVVALRRGRRDARPTSSTVVGRGRARRTVEDVPLDATNLAGARPRSRSRERAGIEPASTCTSRKGIPVAGGMAGGSADAAATLVACDALWGTGLSRDELRDLAAELGSDVPFALLGGTALGHGPRRAADARRSPAARFHWVFAVADGGLSTAGGLRRVRPAARAAHRSLPRAAASPTRCMAALRAGDADALGRALPNDLQAAALSLRPALRADRCEVGAGARRARRASSRAPARPARSSSRDDGARARPRRRADRVAARAGRAGAAHGPVHGARVVASGAPDGAAQPASTLEARHARRYGTRTLLDDVTLGVDDGRPDRRRRPQRRRQVDAAPAARRARGPPTPAGSTRTRRPARRRRSPSATTSTPARRVRVAASSATAPSTSGPATRGSATCSPACSAARRADLDRCSTAPSDRCPAASAAGSALAALLVADPDLLVLDEPTNHLDVEGIAWLAAHLRGRARLARSSSSPTTAGSSTRSAPATWEVHDGAVHQYDGGYAAYVLARAERDADRGRRPTSAGRTCCARSSPGCAAARRRARASRSSASTRRTR